MPVEQLDEVAGDTSLNLWTKHIEFVRQLYDLRTNPAAKKKESWME